MNAADCALITVGLLVKDLASTHALNFHECASLKSLRAARATLVTSMCFVTLCSAAVGSGVALRD